MEAEASLPEEAGVELKAPQDVQVAHAHKPQFAVQWQTDLIPVLHTSDAHAHSHNIMVPPCMCFACPCLLHPLAYTPSAGTLKE